MSRTVRTVEEDLAALQEKRTKVLQDVVKARLSSHPLFEAMVDAFKKTNRYLKEAENLLDAEKYEARREALLERLNALDEKRAVAEAAKSDLAAVVEQHKAVQEELAQTLIAFLDDGEIPEDFDARMTEMLTELGVDELAVEPSDPFAAYRRQAKSED